MRNYIRNGVRKKRASMPIKGKSQVVRGLEYQGAGSLKAYWDLKLLQRS